MVGTILLCVFLDNREVNNSFNQPNELNTIIISICSNKEIQTKKVKQFLRS